MSSRSGWLIVMVSLCAWGASAETYFDAEGGWVFGGYNDVRIPPATGTEFSLTNDLHTESSRYIRLQAGLAIGKRQEVSVLFAPLTVQAEGTTDRPIRYRQEAFPAGEPLEARYQFNTYRATWRYRVVESARLDLALGLTGLLRDASISVQGGHIRTTESNVGFVPLISFGLRWRIRPRWDMLLDGDALVAPGGQGRAEDVLIGVQWNAGQNLSLRLGYRVLEGGADVDKVYNFSMFHFLALGMHLDM